MSMPKELKMAFLEEEFIEKTYPILEKYEDDFSAESYEQIKEENPEFDYAELDAMSKILYGIDFKEYLVENNFIDSDKEIADEVKDEWDADEERIIIIPEGRKTIGNNAFACSFGKKVILPGSITHIGHRAFAQTTIDEIVFPDSITQIRNEACSWNHFRKISLPANLTEIGTEAFAYSWELEEITLPQSLEKIGYGAFMHSEKLCRFYGKPLEQIECCDYAFDECESMADENGFIVVNGKLYRSLVMYRSKHVKVPDTVSKISTGAFLMDREVKCRDKRGEIIRSFCREITIPRSVKEIASDAFSGANQLKKLHLPKGITVTGDKDRFFRKITVIYY